MSYTRKKVLVFILLTQLLLVLGLPVAAQLGTVPYTFSPGTTILSSEVNSNFSTIYSNALNRTGGTMSGTLNVANVEPLSNNSYALGSSGNRFSNIFSVLGNFSGTLTGAAANFSGLFTATGVGSHTIGGGGTATTSTLFVNGASGANLGASLALRKNGTTFGLISSESTWVGGGSTSSDLAFAAETGNGLKFFTNGSATYRLNINSTGDLDTPGTISMASSLIGGRLALSGIVTGADFNGVNTNNYNPTGIGTAAVLRIRSTGAMILSGIAPIASQTLLLMNVGGTSSITLGDEDTNSSAENRFALSAAYTLALDEAVLLWYDSISQRWRLVAQ